MHLYIYDQCLLISHTNLELGNKILGFYDLRQYNSIGTR